MKVEAKLYGGIWKAIPVEHEPDYRGGDKYTTILLQFLGTSYGRGIGEQEEVSIVITDEGAANILNLLKDIPEVQKVANRLKREAAKYAR